MSLYGLSCNTQLSSPRDIEDALEGNICRCAAYRPILDAAHDFRQIGCLRKSAVSQKHHNVGNTSPTHANSLQTSLGQTLRALAFRYQHRTWYRPVSLQQLKDIQRHHPSIKILSLSSDLWPRSSASPNKAVVFLDDVIECKQYSFNEDTCDIGGRVSLADLEYICEQAIQFYDTQRGQVFGALRKELHRKSIQSKNVCSITTSVVRSPSAELALLLTTVNAVMFIASKGTEMEFPVTSANLIDLRNNGSIVIRFQVPVFQASNKAVFRTYRHAKRRNAETAIVHACLNILLGSDDVTIVQASFKFGGLRNNNILTASNTQNYVLGKIVSQLDMEEALKALCMDCGGISDHFSGTATYRQTLALAFLREFFHEIKITGHSPQSCQDLERQISRGTRSYGQPPSKYDQFNKSKASKDVYFQHATGNAQYTDDIPVQRLELHGCPVLSSSPRARVEVNIDPALSLPGVVAVIDHTIFRDPEANIWGQLSDEPFLAVDEVFTAGQVVAMVIANTPLQARAGALAVQIKYEQLPPILTLRQGIEAKSFFQEYSHTVTRGDAHDALARADHIVKGTTQIGGQEHFYIETQSCLVVPKDGGENLEVWSATQSPTDV
jgi:xanthine dehydrogenase/oxidase